MRAHSFGRSARRTRLLLVAALGLAASGMAASVGGARASDEGLALANRVLEQRIALAGGKEFYLVLDPSTRALTLHLGGATLQHYAVEGLEIGRRRWAYVPLVSNLEWAGVVWRGGRVDPARDVPRVERRPGAEAPAPPPPPEDQIVVPMPYRIRFADGLIVEVVARQAARGWGVSVAREGLSRWWRDFRVAVSPAGSSALRLRLSMRAEEAASLYRALPPDTALLIVPSGAQFPPVAPRRAGSRS